jgi:hypothetical protein
MSNGGVLPGLGKRSVVPDVSMVGETVADIAELSLLGVLLDGIESRIFRDLFASIEPWHTAQSNKKHTSILAFVQRGISTTMFRTLPLASAKRGMS